MSLKNIAKNASFLSFIASIPLTGCVDDRGPSNDESDDLDIEQPDSDRSSGEWRDQWNGVYATSKDPGGEDVILFVNRGNRTGDLEAILVSPKANATGADYFFHGDIDEDSDLMEGHLFEEDSVNEAKQLAITQTDTGFEVEVPSGATRSVDPYNLPDIPARLDDIDGQWKSADGFMVTINPITTDDGLETRAGSISFGSDDGTCYFSGGSISNAEADSEPPINYHTFMIGNDREEPCIVNGNEVDDLQAGYVITAAPKGSDDDYRELWLVSSTAYAAGLYDPTRLFLRLTR